LTVDANALGQQVAELKVTDGATYSAAGALLVSVVSKQRELEATRKHLLEPIREAERRIADLMKPPLDRLNTAATVIRGAMSWYTDEQKRIAEAERAAAWEAARVEREAAERAAAEARAALAAASSEAEAATARAVLERAQTAATTRVAVMPEPDLKVEGISNRNVWRAEITDLKAFLSAALKDPVLICHVEVNQAALNALARAYKDKLDIPGVRATRTTSTTVRTAT
jgi:hypothetical protein